MAVHDGNHEHLQPLVNGLVTIARSVDKDDLAGLAKMHGYCEAIGTVSGPQSEASNPDVFSRAVSLSGLLESLILGEAPDTEGAIRLLADSASDLVRRVAAAYGVEPEAKPPATEARLTPRDMQGVVPPPAPPLASGESAPAHLPSSDAARTEARGSSPPSPQAESPRGGESSYVPEPLRIDPKEIEFVQAFVEEAGEHLDAIEAAVLEVEREPESAARIDDLFRPFHTIKGMAGFLNLRDVSCLTHEVETLLDQGRKGKRAITPGLIDVVFAVADILKAQVAEIRGYLASPQGGTVPQPPVADMIGRLRDVVAGRADVSKRSSERAAARQAAGRAEVDEEEVPVRPPQSGTPAQSRSSEPGGPAAKGPPVRDGATQAVTGDQSVRIDTGKLDALVDMVGELVIAQTLVSANDRIAVDPRLSKDVAQVSKIVRDVQETAMAMRMVPIGPTFQKMARLIRDVSRKASKLVELKISGEETELDKNVIQQIGDPLVHMVRNAVDHGIEPPDGRRRARKPDVGQVCLAAYHQGGNIVIEISDDGKGLDPVLLVAKGIEKGLVQPHEELTDQQAYALIFAPGFSMASQITDISGRGVGMDVVRRNIEHLRGRVEIESEKDRGSTFKIRLPLTLAIIDGMVVRVGSERFIIQTIVVEQSLRPKPAQITTVQHKGELLNMRGKLIPLIQLGQLFELGPRVNPCDTMVVIAHCEGRQIGLVVDELIGQQQVVIKTLGERFEELRGVSGAAILGDGRVGLILEMSGLAAAHEAKTLPPVPWKGANGWIADPAEETDASVATAPAAADRLPEPHLCPA